LPEKTLRSVCRLLNRLDRNFTVFDIKLLRCGLFWESAETWGYFGTGSPAGCTQFTNAGNFDRIRDLFVTKLAKTKLLRNVTMT